MKKRTLSILALFTVLMLVVACGKEEPTSVAPKREEGKEQPVQLTVSAAASLKEALNEIADEYKKMKVNVTISYNFGSSGVLQQQIEQGAPADLFISAGKPQMDALEQKGLIIKDSRKDLLSNKLVLIVPADSKLQLGSFADVTRPEVKRAALGSPDTVPAGKYVKESYEKQGLWKQVEAKQVLAKDVRQVLAYVESGEVDAGFVYLTDAKTSGKVKVAAESDPATHAPIVYPAAIVKDAHHFAEAENYLKFLQSGQARQIFEKYGFVVK